MGFVVKAMDKAYYKRFQVKYARRRAGKTDYRARLKLTRQSKNKYNTPKYRFAVRFTNKDIVCQIINATIAGDIVVAAAYSHELPNYGMPCGLTNYSAAYATGLLLARRVLTKFNLAETYAGCLEVDGEDYNVEAEGDARPLRANLDVGLVRTTTGNRVFGALKGALDGGLDVPHSEKRFAGYDKPELDAETHKKYIFGGHVAEYMEMLEEEEPERYAAQFASYVAAGIDSENYEEKLEECHAKIRANPVAVKKERKKPAKKVVFKQVRLTLDQRRANLKEKLESLKAMDESDEE